MNKKQEILKNICKKNKGKLDSISRDEAQVTKEISEIENSAEYIPVVPDIFSPVFWVADILFTLNKLLFR